jgi:D-glycero-D-manno-heptose 1,7-bisphosphate phosphatase
MSHRAAFIDRDGVLNAERGFVHRIEDFELLPGAVEALRRLQVAGYRRVVVTNQSGIARGLYTETDFERLMDEVRARLRAEGVSVDAVEYCPHLPDAPLAQYRRACECRKPEPGMLLAAIRALDIDPAASFLVGDRISDVQAGRAAGVGRCFLVRSGYALSREAIAAADAVSDDLLGCVKDVLSGGPIRAD